VLDLCNFFDSISQKYITKNQCDELKEEIIVILCELEMYFPLSFFDIMVHLMVHIVSEIRELGLAFPHEMYALERFNGGGGSNALCVTGLNWMVASYRGISLRSALIFARIS
jgi:hypothetical protein